ncbi:MAG: diaminopimelate decarboxylase, partial [Nitrospirae bacterium]
FITRVLYRKDGADRKFIIVDGGMNDLLRPSLYNAYHNIIPVRKKRTKKVFADVVGPICESGDFLARGRQLPSVQRGELLAVMSAGAYGFSMSSNYNSRPRPAEVLVDGKKHYLIRKRETLTDLLRGEKIPEELRG